jgi:lysyl-tRNA synthetase class 2
VNLFRFIPGYTEHIYEANKEPLLSMFVAFLIAFALVRLYTRLARTRGWGSGNVGGVHMHHMVVGIILMSIGGALAFTQFRDSEIFLCVAAILFGVGGALTLDEFAMILHLKDVYWTEEGRTSVDAMLMGVAGAGLLLVAAVPTKENSGIRLEFGDFQISIGIWLALAINVVFVAITFLKKKPLLGVVGLFVFLVSIVGAIRLGKPGSPWAHWFYDPERGSARFRARRERKLARSERRYTVGWSGRFERWFSDLVGGAPTLPSPDAEKGQAH